MPRLSPARAFLLVFSVLVPALLLAPAALMNHQRSFYRDKHPDHFKSWTRNGSFSAIDSYTLSEDNYYYAARMRQAGTHALPGDPYIAGNRSAALTATDFITFWTLGLFYRLAGGVKAAWLLATLALSALWVPLLYALLRAMGARRPQALFAAVSCTLFADLARVVFFNARLLAYLKAAAQYVFWFMGPYSYFFGPTRLTGPLFTYPCLFAAALLLARAERKRTWPAALAAGAAGGALAYVHSDVWLAFLGATAVYAAALSARARKLDAKLASALAVAAAVSAPLVLLRSAHPIDPAFLGKVAGRAPALESLPLLAGAWLIWRGGPRRGLWFWSGCLLAALFLACNVQVILGWTLGQGHWYYIGHLFLALVACRWAAERLGGKESRWVWAAACAFLLAVPRAVGYAAQHHQLYALPAAEEEALRWLDSNIEKDAVVAALSPETNFRLPVHSGASLAVSFLFPVMSDIPARENAQRLVSLLRLYDARLDRYLEAGFDSSGLWGEKLWQGRVDEASRERSGQFLVHFCALAPEKVLALLADAAAGPPRDFPVDYAWVGPFERSLLGSRGLKKARKVFGNAAVSIYRLR